MVFVVFVDRLAGFFEEFVLVVEFGSLLHEALLLLFEFAGEAGKFCALGVHFLFHLGILPLQLLY